MTPTHQTENADHDMHSQGAAGHGNDRSYLTLGLELVADFVVMFFAMYAMIATLDHLYLNISNVYMTMMMVAPMALLMLVFMRHMFQSRRKNMIIVGLAIAVFAVGWIGMRTQLGVGDAQFARSMIPHHSGAILMCREAKLSDPELMELCRGIIDAQEREISQMKRILERL